MKASVESAIKSAFALVLAAAGALTIAIGASTDGGTPAVIVGLILCTPWVFGIVKWYADPKTRVALAAINRNREFGLMNPAMVCPHCQTKGRVRSKSTERKTGVSGAKIATAVLFSPLALLVTGVSSHEKATQATCETCSSTWVF